MTGDLTITFRSSDFHTLPLAAQQLIGMLVGPLFPDAQGMVTMELSELRWSEIQAAIDAAKEAQHA